MKRSAISFALLLATLAGTAQKETVPPSPPPAPQPVSIEIKLDTVKLVFEADEVSDQSIDSISGVMLRMLPDQIDRSRNINVSVRLKSDTNSTRKSHFRHSPDNRQFSKKLLVMVDSISKKRTPYLGIQLTEEETGLYISRVLEGSPAEQAGLQQGDYIHSLNDSLVEDFTSLKNLLRKVPEGAEVQVGIRRAGQALTFQVTPQHNQPPQLAGISFNNGAITLLDFHMLTPKGFADSLINHDKFFPNAWNDFEANRLWKPRNPALGLVVQERKPDHKGEIKAVIESVLPNSIAEKAGFEAGDILLSFNGTPVSTVDDVLNAYREARGQASIEAEVLKGKKKKKLVLQLQDSPTRVRL